MLIERQVVSGYSHGNKQALCLCPHGIQIYMILHNYTIIHICIYTYIYVMCIYIYTISHRSINISFSGWISTKSHTTAGFLGGSPHGSKLVGNPGDESSSIPGWSSCPLSKRNPLWKHPELLQYMEYTYIDLYWIMIYRRLWVCRFYWIHI